MPINRQRNFTRKCNLFLGIVLIAFTQAVQASFTDSITIGNPKALSLGHAVTADPPDIDSIHFNPAGLTQLKGRQFFLKGVVGAFTTEMYFGDYGPYQQAIIDKYREQYEAFKDENGVLQYGRRPYDEYVYDEALNAHSKAEGGPTLMLPGRMVDMPAAIGGTFGVSYNPPGSKFTFATNFYAPMISGFHRADDDPGRFAQQRAAFTLITYFSPSVAYEFSDKLSVGLSVGFSYSGMGLDLPAREPHEAIFLLGSPLIQKTFCNPDGTPKGTIDVCTEVPPYTEYGNLSFEVEESVAIGYNLGILWHPTPWLSFGLSYNSAIDTSMEGRFSFPIYDPFKTFLVNFESSPAWDSVVTLLGSSGYKLPTAEQTAEDAEGSLTVSYEIPQRVNAGVSVNITPKWKYNVDIRWTEWSAFSNIDLDFGKDVPLLMWGSLADLVGTGGSNGISPNSVKYQLGLQDVTYWGMGTEYRYSERLALRAGFEKRPSAVPHNAPNVFMPMNDGNLYSLGFGYKMKGDSQLDVGVGYLKSETHYPACSAKLGNGCDNRDVVYPVYLGQDIRSKVEFLLFEIGYRWHF